MKNSRVRVVARLTFLCWFLFFERAALAQSFSDSFVGRQLLTGTSALITGSNTNATVESFEPQHAGKIGGHSVWISWLAPDDGLVTLSTTNSVFDTLLAVYTLEPGNDPPMQRLQEVAANDDYGTSTISYLQFGANSNQTYQIAVDGFNGLTGDISLQFNFISSTNLQPTVLVRPGDSSLRIGDPLILTIGIVPVESMNLQWYLNGNPLDPTNNNPTLVIPSLQDTNLGFYSVELQLDDDSFFSTPVEIQVNSEGQTNVLARYKIADAAQSGLTQSNSTFAASIRTSSFRAVPAAFTPTPSSSTVVLGYNGTQIFNTTNAIFDTNAPTICGATGGAPYWFSYQAPTNGIMTVDTSGSSFNTLLGVFTYNGTLTSYTNLISVTCDITSGSNGLPSMVQFQTQTSRNYFIVLDGVNGARGIAHLNYALSTGLSPQPPLIASQPRSLVVFQKTPVALSTVARGTAPFAYQWWRSNLKLPQQTNASLLLYNPQSQDSGTYAVVVTNSSGTVTSSPAIVSVISAPLTTLNVASNWFISAFPGTRGFQYSVDSSGSTSIGSWLHLTNAFPDYGGIIWLTNVMKNNNSMFLRVHSP